MLKCNIDLKSIPATQLKCGNCKTCQPKSALNYPFERDLTTSEELQKALIAHIENSTGFKCLDPEIDKNPDIRVIDINNGGRLVCRVEAKYLGGKAFVKAKEKLVDKLEPKETLVVDEPKLLSYLKCKEKDLNKYKKDIPLYIVWKFDRPCADVGGITIFQEINTLEGIYHSRGRNRAFERETAKGDIVHGKKLGITAKYHFSLKECRPIEELIPEILAIK